MKINWFSPILPDRSGIAAVTSSILPEMASEAELTLWANNGNYDRSLEQYAKIQTYQHNPDYWHYENLKLLTNADAIIYNIGNNILHHFKIWCISQYCPGIIILHDPKLFHLFLAMCINTPHGKDLFSQLAATYYDCNAEKAIIDMLNFSAAIDSVADKFAFAELALRNAKSVIVHSVETFEELKQVCSIPVYCLNLPYRIKKARRLIKGSKKKSTYRLILFGYGLGNRRVFPILEALARLPEKKQFTLDIIGKVEDKQVLTKAIKSFGISDIVKCYDHLPEIMLNKFLSNADLAFNLRYPTMGEASYSQLTIWEYCLPSLVTNIGYYRHLPTKAVVHINLESEVADIIKALTDFIRYPEKYKEMGAAGREYLEECFNPQDYVQAIIEIAKTNSNLSYIKRRMITSCAHRLIGCHAKGYEKRVIKKVLGLFD